MPSFGVLLALTVLFALAFDYINGFHDTANAIATVVSTRVLTPMQAIIMAAVLNFAGALFNHGVAQTVASGIVEKSSATETVVLAAVIGGIVWNLITWRFGIPSSSSHALIGGLVGAGSAHAGLHAIQWKTGVWDKVLIPLVTSPVAGFILAFAVMALITALFRNTNPGTAGPVFKNLQRVSAAAMAYAHGNNDAQKSMGVITLALFAHGMIKDTTVPLWVILACAAAMAFGTAAGGWRIIRTMGHKIMRLEPVNGFAAETSGATIILIASYLKMPVSTTHVLAGSIFGVGASKGLHTVRWTVARQMVVAWILTIPAAALVAGLAYWLLALCGA